MGASASHGGGGGGSTELPPPTYEEAMFLIGDEKLRVVLEESKYAARLVPEISDLLRTDSGICSLSSLSNEAQ
jgi:hypothetical protein